MSVQGLDFSLLLLSVNFTPILFLQCLSKVRQAFAAVKEALMSGNINQVASDFGCCQIPKDPYDQVMTCTDEQLALVQAVLFIFCFLKKFNICTFL